VGGDHARARDAFLRSAQAAPRDPHAWANLGTAAWQAGDTASAVVGWQRALRLSPRDAELRARLSAVRAPQLRGAARVWPVAPLPVALIAVVLCVSRGAGGAVAPGADTRREGDRESSSSPRCSSPPSPSGQTAVFARRISRSLPCRRQHWIRRAPAHRQTRRRGLPIRHRERYRPGRPSGIDGLICHSRDGRGLVG
jgi:hypothetical protein